MNELGAHLLKLSRRIYRKISATNDVKGLPLDLTGQQASDAIKRIITSDRPCLVGRFGHNEVIATACYVARCEKGNLFSKSLRYVTGKTEPFWWDKQFIGLRMRNNAGFFPISDDALDAYGSMMLDISHNIDILGSWRPEESKLSSYLSDAVKISLRDIEPYYHKDPWTEALKDRKVLVVHPFEESINRQYAKREQLFSDPRILPEFELKTLKAVQSIAEQQVPFNSWFEALQWMCDAISQVDFDVAIVGAGAYGLPLASFIKTKLEKKAIHMGGAVQILFGIKGKRWDNGPFFQQLYNEHWVRPLRSEIPEKSAVVESGCYW